MDLIESGRFGTERTHFGTQTKQITYWHNSHSYIQDNTASLINSRNSTSCSIDSSGNCSRKSSAFPTLNRNYHLRLSHRGAALPLQEHECLLSLHAIRVIVTIRTCAVRSTFSSCLQTLAVARHECWRSRVQLQTVSSRAGAADLAFIFITVASFFHSRRLSDTRSG